MEKKLLQELKYRLFIDSIVKSGSLWESVRKANKRRIEVLQKQIFEGEQK